LTTLTKITREKLFIKPYLRL